LRPQVSQLLISCNRHHSAYARFAERTVADNRHEFQGPLAGLEAAHTVIDCDYVAVVSCDTPHLPYDLVARLLQPFEKDEGDAIDISYVHDGLRAQYLFALMRRDCLSSISSFLDTNHRAVREWYDSKITRLVDFSDCPESFRNYNNPA
jgi:molybdopterin-guanine dinucleotide biosynthesis protein A